MIPAPRTALLIAFLAISTAIPVSASHAASASPTDAEQFSFFLYGRLVLARATDDKLATGTPRIVKEADDHDDSVLLARPIRDGRIPPVLLQLKRRRVRWIAEDHSCEGTIRRIHLMASVMTGSRYLEETSGPPRTWEERLWAAGNYYFVADLANVSGGGCFGASWARSTALPAISVTPATPIDRSLQEAALAAFRQLPQYADIQRDYDKYRAARAPQASPHWETLSGTEPRISLIRFPSAGGIVQLISVSGSVRRPCDNFEGRLWALWAVTETTSGPALSLRNRPDPAHSPDELTLTDAVTLADPDHPALVFRQRLGKGLIQWTEGRYAIDPQRDVSAAEHLSRAACPAAQ